MNKYGNPLEVTQLSTGNDYLPSDVFNHVNKNVCNGGGGSKTQTSTTTIDPEIKRAIMPALSDVTSKYQRGEFGQVADTAGVEEALGMKSDLARQTYSEGLGTENLLNQLRSSEGQMMAGQQGALGSARADRAREAAMTDMAMQLQQADLGARSAAADQLGQAQMGQRSLEQEVLDKDVKGAERYFGMLQGVPQGSTTTQTGGGK